jgi:hypothetical protein
MKSKAVVLAAAAALSLSSCSYQGAKPGVMGVVMKGSFFGTADQTLIDCIDPSQTKNELNNTVYWYPAHQISWSATTDPGSERGPYDVVSSATAPADMLVPLTVSFDLTRNCDLLKKFHANFGTKYNGSINEDGSETDGWKQLVNYVVGQPLQNTLNTVSQNYTWQEIWNNEKVRIEFTQALDRELPNASKQRTEGVEYFTNFQIAVYKPTPANPALKQAIEDQQKNIQVAKSEQAQAEAQLKTAQAQTATAEAEAAKQRAIIAGYGSIDDYNRAMAVEKGLNPFQPTYVVPQPAH